MITINLPGEENANSSKSSILTVMRSIQQISAVLSDLRLEAMGLCDTSNVIIIGPSSSSPGVFNLALLSAGSRRTVIN